MGEDDDIVIAEAMSYIGGGESQQMPQQPQQMPPQMPPQMPQQMPPQMPQVYYQQQQQQQQQQPAQFVEEVDLVNNNVRQLSQPSKSKDCGMFGDLGWVDDYLMDLKTAGFIVIGYILISMLPISDFLDRTLPEVISSLPMYDIVIKGILLGVCVVLVMRFAM